MMNCLCGHSDVFHVALDRRGDELGACEECDQCAEFTPDPNWEPPDPPGWEGGFAENH